MYDEKELKIIWKSISSKLESDTIFHDDATVVINNLCSTIGNGNFVGESLLLVSQMIEQISTWCVKYCSNDALRLQVASALFSESNLKGIVKYLTSSVAPTVWSMNSVCLALENIIKYPWVDLRFKLHIVNTFFNPEVRLYASLVDCCKLNGKSVVISTIKVVEAVAVGFHEFIISDISPFCVAGRSAGLLSSVQYSHIEAKYSSLLFDMLSIMSHFSDCDDTQEHMLRVIADVVEQTELLWLNNDRFVQLKHLIMKEIVSCCAGYCIEFKRQLSLSATAITVIKLCSRLNSEFRHLIVDQVPLIDVCLQILRLGYPALRSNNEFQLYALLRKGACAIIHNICLESDIALILCYSDVVTHTAPFQPCSLNEQSIIKIQGNPTYKELHVIQTLISTLLVERDERVFRDIWLTISLLAKFEQNINVLLDCQVNEVIIGCLSVHLTEASGYRPDSNVIITTWRPQGSEVCALVALSRICSALCNPQLLVSTGPLVTTQVNAIFKRLRTPTLLKVLQLIASLNTLIDYNNHTREDVCSIQFLGMMCLCALYGQRGADIQPNVLELMHCHASVSLRSKVSIIAALKKAVCPVVAAVVSDGGSSVVPKSNMEAFFRSQVSWLVFTLSNLCMNWNFNRELSMCSDLLQCFIAITNRCQYSMLPAAHVDHSKDLVAGLTGEDEYWQDPSVLECVLLSCIHLYLSFPVDTPVDSSPHTITYDVTLEKGGPGVALGMLVIQDNDGTIKLKSIQSNIIVKQLDAKAEGAMKSGDVLTGIDGASIVDWDLAAVVVRLNDQHLPPGSSVKLTYRRYVSPQHHLWHSQLKQSVENLLMNHFLNKHQTPSTTAAQSQVQLSPLSVKYAYLLMSLLTHANSSQVNNCRNPALVPVATVDDLSDGNSAVWRASIITSAHATAAPHKYVFVNHSSHVQDSSINSSSDNDKEESETTGHCTFASLTSRLLENLHTRCQIQHTNVLTTEQLVRVQCDAFASVVSNSKKCTVEVLRQHCTTMLWNVIKAVDNCASYAQCICPSFKYDPYCRILSNVVYNTQNSSERSGCVGDVCTISAPEFVRVNVLLTKTLAPQTTKDKFKQPQEDLYTHRILLQCKRDCALNHSTGASASASVVGTEQVYSFSPLWNRDDDFTTEVDIIHIVDKLLMRSDDSTAVAAGPPPRAKYPVLAYLMSSNTAAIAAAKQREVDESLVQRRATEIRAGMMALEFQRQQKAAAAAAEAQAQELALAAATAAMKLKGKSTSVPPSNAAAVVSSAAVASPITTEDVNAIPPAAAVPYSLTKMLFGW